MFKGKEGIQEGKGLMKDLSAASGELILRFLKNPMTNHQVKITLLDIKMKAEKDIIISIKAGEPGEIDSHIKQSGSSKSDIEKDGVAMGNIVNVLHERCEGDMHKAFHLVDLLRESFSEVIEERKVEDAN